MLIINENNIHKLKSDPVIGDATDNSCVHKIMNLIKNLDIGYQELFDQIDLNNDHVVNVIELKNGLLKLLPNVQITLSTHFISKH